MATTNKTQQDAEKLAAALAAVKFVKDGDVVGLGTGSTTAFAIKELGKLVKDIRADQTLWQESGTYLKISNVTLSYMFDKKFIARFGMSSLRVYASTDNLITFSKYTGPNPENVTTLGRDISTGYPVPRTYNIGVQLELNTGN